VFRDLKEEISDLYKWVKEFITEDIWHLDLDDFSRASARLLKYLKIAIITFKEIGHLRLGLYAVSLSFFTVMALVPFIAVSFAVTGGLGLKDTLHELLLESTGDNKLFMEYIISFANNIIESSTKDIFGIISFVIFTGTVLWVMLNVEQAFNRIWKVERGRSIPKRLLYYIGILAVAPLMIVVFLSISQFFTEAINSHGIGFLRDAGLFVQISVFYSIIILTFTVMYKYMPSVKVKMGAAFWAAVIAGSVFVGMQYLYMGTQIFVTRLNAVYGAFAALPLFLIWVNISWTIILIGAEISHANQYVDSYNTNSDKELEKEVQKRLKL
jgi:membrane protein